MDIFQAMRELMDSDYPADDYFDALRSITNMTGHVPFGFIWLDLENYAPATPGGVGLFNVEWLPANPGTPREDIISVLETLLKINKNHEERRYDDE